MARPNVAEHSPFFSRYIDLVNGESATEAKRNHAQVLHDFFINLPTSKADFAYGEGKWTIKEVLQHIIDTERIFSYRLLRIARKDTTPLPGFDENSFAENSMADKRTLNELKEEFAAVRKSSDLLVDSLSEEQLQNMGTSSNHVTSANSLAFMIYGHLLHHKKIVEERYL